jgi:hypothetical protein
MARSSGCDRRRHPVTAPDSGGGTTRRAGALATAATVWRRSRPPLDELRISGIALVLFVASFIVPALVVGEPIFYDYVDPPSG